MEPYRSREAELEAENTKLAEEAADLTAKLGQKQRGVLRVLVVAGGTGLIGIISTVGSVHRLGEAGAERERLAAPCSDSVQRIGSLFSSVDHCRPDQIGALVTEQRDGPSFFRCTCKPRAAAITAADGSVEVREWEPGRFAIRATGKYPATGTEIPAWDGTMSVPLR